MSIFGYNTEEIDIQSNDGSISITKPTSSSIDLSVVGSIQSYTTANLPQSATAGTLAYDTTLNIPVYSKGDDKWRKIADDTIVTDYNSSETWIAQNGQKYTIDAEGRMYKLLLRQDMEKDINGVAQTSQAWANGSTINSTKKYNENADPEYAHQFLDFANVNWNDFRGSDGKLEFKMRWKGIEDRFPYDATRPVNFEDAQGNVVDWMTWKQTTEPSSSITGYEQLTEGNNAVYANSSSTPSQRFEGLFYDTDAMAFVDGNSSATWFYASGLYTTRDDVTSDMGGLDALPIMIMSNSQWLYHTKVEIWLRVPTQVYLIAGQSNAVGFGQLSEIPASVSLTGVEYWGGGSNGSASTAWGAMTAGSTNGNQFGYEIPLADLTKPSHFIKYAWGGTNLHTQWNPTGGTMYANWLSTFNIATSALNKPYQIMGLFWLQGESDSNNATDAGNYQANLTNLITAMRTAVGFSKMKFFIAKIYAPNLNQTYVNVVRNAQQAVADADSNVFRLKPMI